MKSSILNRKILVVEDVKFMRKLVKQALERIGFASVLEADDGEQALGLMERQPVELVITDIEMQPCNGLQLVQQIRAGIAPVDPATRVIFLSGLDDLSTLEAASELDVSGFLVKPVSADQLREKIEESFASTVRLRKPAFYKALSFAPASLTPQGKNKAEASGYRFTTTRIARKEGDITTRQPAQVPNNQLVEDESAPITPGYQRMFVALEQLHEGMILGEDVVAKGAPILRAGTVLVPGHLMVLRDMRALLEKSELRVDVQPAATNKESPTTRNPDEK
ncbi:MAG: response regulator [Candidatus Thiodiazotropha taylori]